MAQEGYNDNQNKICEQRVRGINLPLRRKSK